MYKQTKIDRSDAKILATLQSDARQTNRSVAANVGLAPSTTLDRVRSLEERGVVTGYHATVDLAAMGRPIQAIVALRLRPKTGPLVERAVERLWSLPETLGVLLVTGIDDVIVHLSVSDTDALRHLVLDSISSIEGVVDERTSLVFEYRQKRVVEPVGT
ncbi:MAG TPA: Lrp/AsnC family transcriptional regulator [Acidimicrobiales bacterium]|jgi:DNA-binding Lrp family transcriptional regulator|nr:Lrp/AsnC family transcriptional regulator [Actinomycetes bacterium]MDP6106676.1 Lrp/AsnC family transcriptional regulator [Acidimicrobiales bacterium]MCP4844326.1 Lrp/AsnC family transcriptional regulator [Actinomycetes bacterium]MDP7124957.1 Lrp/AsnC family transcriptional regulator [Acidimicrobiales bacterium]MDP7352453.1 Lrp/AsnC family transcriptional regulator [Acidimicrobiales bacterium]|tara:strand:+ start:3631 stop:4107 length:477 start_codon:yes stop_codon:yes gene_type:complete